MPSLTPAQQQLYDWLAMFVQNNGYAPTLRQMMQAMGLRSPAPVQARLKQLKQKGYLDWDEGQARTLRLLPLDRGVPLRGVIQMDGQIEPYVHQATDDQWPGLQLPVGCHGLRVQGNGLSRIHLLDGDILLFQKPVAVNQVPSGSLILARVMGYGTTLKSLERNESLVLLYPVSCRDQLLTVMPQELEIQGVLIGVWRSYAAAI
jgi:repressor LexA